MAKLRMMWGLGFAVALASASAVAVEGAAYYRYLNEHGVKVLGHSIPAAYADRGYEILSATGRVLKVVDPAPAPEDPAMVRARLERKQRLAELKLKYDHLAKRYSSTLDIDAAKRRKLVHVDAAIHLVLGSIANTQEQIDKVTAQAADHERAGRAVPASLMERLESLNEEMKVSKVIHQQRIKEKDDIDYRFEQDKKLFVEGVAAFDPDKAENGENTVENFEGGGAPMQSEGLEVTTELR